MVYESIVFCESPRMFLHPQAVPAAAAAEPGGAALRDRNQFRLALAAPPASAEAGASWLPLDDRPWSASAVLMECNAFDLADRTHSAPGGPSGGLMIHSRDHSRKGSRSRRRTPRHPTLRPRIARWHPASNQTPARRVEQGQIILFLPFKLGPPRALGKPFASRLPSLRRLLVS
jgi:hypothetical protein